jgi:hypothetical protein
VLANGPELDRDASRQLVQQLFPNATLSDTVDGHLDFLNPPKNQVFVGCYGELRLRTMNWQSTTHQKSTAAGSTRRSVARHTFM